MITALVLLPVTAVLVWLYGYFLPQRWDWSRFDAALLMSVISLAVLWIRWIRALEFADAGPVFSELVAAAGGYTIIVIAFATGLAWRRAGGRRRPAQ